MKVGVFLTALAPETGGGYTIQADIFQALVELADASRHTFVVFCDPAYLPPVSLKNIQIVPFAAPNFFERVVERGIREVELFRIAWRIPTRLNRLAHQHGIEFMCFFDPYQVVHVDVPYSTMVLDLQHRLQPWFPEVSAQGVWDRREAYHQWFMRRASFLIAGTETGKGEIERFYHVPPERIVILPHPTPAFALHAPSADAAVLGKYQIPSGYLFYPAQFWAHKNHSNLLLALKELRDQHHIQLPLVLVGSDKGNQAYVRKRVQELDLSDQVHILGFIPTADLVALYQNALALTYVTFFGPENLPPLEAFALGCPVIASNVPGAQEQLGDAALLVAPDNPAEISQAIRQLCHDAALRETLVERGKARAAKWTGHDFVRGVFAMLDKFEATRRSWGAG